MKNELAKQNVLAHFDESYATEIFVMHHDHALGRSCDKHSLTTSKEVCSMLYEHSLQLSRDTLTLKWSFLELFGQ
jgi:hypothetical protein